MAHFALTTVIPTKSGYAWFPIEVPEDDLDSLYERIADDGLLKCTKLHFRSGGGGSKIIFAREPWIVGLPAIITITALHIELSEPGVDQEAEAEVEAA